MKKLKEKQQHNKKKKKTNYHNINLIWLVKSFMCVCVCTCIHLFAYILLYKEEANLIFFILLQLFLCFFSLFFSLTHTHTHIHTNKYAGSLAILTHSLCFKEYFLFKEQFFIHIAVVIPLYCICFIHNYSNNCKIQACKK